LGLYSKKFQDLIETSLNLFNNTTNATFILELQQVLSPNESGSMIVDSQNIFKGARIHLFNKSIEGNSVEIVIQQMVKELQDSKSTFVIDQEELKDQYYLCMRTYERAIDTYLDNKNEKKGILLSEIRSFCLRNQLIVHNDWNEAVKSSIPELCGLLFAYWTLSSSESYFRNGGTKNERSYLKKPHPGQALAVFILLGIGLYPEKGVVEQVGNWFGITGRQKKGVMQLMNCLVQVSTGQGKSIISAITSIILGLCGYEIYCACYSEYLSRRDLEDFNFMFVDLDVKDRIHYGTFNELFERVINHDGQIRLLVTNSILNTKDSSSSIKHIKSKGKVLFIDEVDVFFNKEFYGNVYSPVARICSKEIRELIDLIWSQRKIQSVKYDEALLKKICGTDTYKKCVGTISKWAEGLLREDIKTMIHCLKQYDPLRLTIL
jgi:hypothetical protein